MTSRDSELISFNRKLIFFNVCIILFQFLEINLMLDWRKQKVQEIRCLCVFFKKEKKSLLYLSSTMNMHMSTSRVVLLEGSGADTPHRRPMPTWPSEVDPWAGMPPHRAVWCSSTRWNFGRWCSSLEASSDAAVTIAGADDVLPCSQWSGSLKKPLTETPVLKGSPALPSPRLICGNRMGNKDGTPETPHKRHSQVSFISTSGCPPWGSRRGVQNCLLLIWEPPKPTQWMFVEWMKQKNWLKESAL